MHPLHLKEETITHAAQIQKKRQWQKRPRSNRETVEPTGPSPQSIENKKCHSYFVVELLDEKEEKAADRKGTMNLERSRLEMGEKKEERARKVALKEKEEEGGGVKEYIQALMQRCGRERGMNV